MPILHWYLTIPQTCFDGIQNQGETAIDRGGPCVLLDDRTLQPHAILWARSFLVRDGSYNAVAYIQNPNDHAGVAQVHYRFSLYDSQNFLIATREGVTFIMPGGITPVFESGINAGKRIVAHTYFEFTDDTLQWERMKSVTASLSINNMEVASIDTVPRISAVVTNTSSFETISDTSFIAVVFDTAGNAFAASATTQASLTAGEQSQIVFTWPDPYAFKVGRVDIIPIHAPKVDPVTTQ